MIDPKTNAEPSMVCSQCLGRYVNGKPQCGCASGAMIQGLAVIALIVIGYVALLGYFAALAIKSRFQ